MVKTEDLHIEVRLPASERVIVRSKEELYQKLNEAEEDIRSGSTYTVDEVFSNLRGKYGI